MAQSFQVRVAEIEDFPRAALRRVVVERADGAALPLWHAGQYAQLSFPGHEPRPYSMANAPGQGMMEFHIRRAGSGASAYATGETRVGDLLDLSAPYGDCIYVRDCDRPLIAVAGGSGLSSMKAIVEEALADPARTAPVYLYCGARTRNDLYLQDHFMDLEDTDPRFHYVAVLSEETHDGYRSGLVGDVMIADRPDLSGARVYGAGPLGMVRHLSEKALACGLDPAHLHTDLHQFQA